MKKSLFSQAFIYLILSLLLVVTLLSSVFFFSIRRSVAVWNVNRGQRLENLILPLITQVYRSKGELKEIEIHQALSPFLTGNVFAYVFDTDRTPIYIYSSGGRVPIYDSEEISRSLERLRDRSRPLTAIVGEGNIIGYLAADTLGFSHDVANRRFLQSVFTFVGWGGVIALFVALVAAYIFSKILSKQARGLVTGLQELTRGEREVDFPSPQSEEMSEIANSARRLQQQLQQEEQLRRQWAEDVAHDLRTPVSALKVQLEGLADGILKPTYERFNALFHEVGRIDSLVKDLGELNQVESPEINLKFEYIDLPFFLEQFKTIVLSEISKGSELHIDCRVKNCRADRHYLNRAVTNVVQNAITHGDKDGAIFIRVYELKSYTVIEVRNKGWIDRQHINRVFNRLYRGSNSRSEPGSGLGLPITRAIMRAHGGDAWISQKGRETTVSLTIRNSDQGEDPQNDTQNPV